MPFNGILNSVNVTSNANYGLLDLTGEMWHYQCQTCECLDGEIDCWPIDCPPVNCHNAFLPEGDCCYRCPEEESDGDRCTHWHANNTECQLIQNTIDTIESGTRVTMPHHHCISCKCQVSISAKYLLSPE